MKIAVVGTGYVGLGSAACFAELGHTVIGVDIDEEKVKRLKKGDCVIYEPELPELLKRGLESGRLTFTTELMDALPDVSVLFSAVATPPNEDFSADLRAVFTVADSVAKNIDHDLVFVNKSTVPVGTGEECEKLIKGILTERGVDYAVPVVSNPEFLREGHAVRDTMQPDRIVVGVNGNDWAKQQMDELYNSLTRVGKPIIWMNRESSEIVKYASNAFLANKISFINMLSELCEETGGNIRDISRGMGMDDRIGPRFLHSGIGYGGSCFPKDVKALMHLGKHVSVSLPLVEATHEINQRQRDRFFQKLLNHLSDGQSVGVWGLSFKPRTDDMREAPSLDLIPSLVENGHKVRVYDPVAMDNAKKLLPSDTNFCESPLDAAKEVDALIVLTEWDEFRGVDLKKLREVMKGDALFDGRNIYEPDEVKEAGLMYVGIGIPDQS